VTFFLSKKSRELEPEKPRFYYFFSVYIFAARLRRGVFFISPTRLFFKPRPKNPSGAGLYSGLKKNAALRGQLKWPPKRAAEDGGLSGA
jgi:hypothetical protein